MNFAATKEEARQRLDTCAQCEHNKYGLCTSCGCVIKAKVWLLNAECPQGKWAKINMDTNNADN